jgi:alkanesulfonate monooxygenase SsuD/methylene tetrahydromethanopterin reductase-like flavin-dependent oxidoreductase (luciferase family)
MNGITFGVHLPIMGFDGNQTKHSREQILSFAEKAEKLGYDSLSVNDHVVFTTSWLDAVTTLSAVAGITSKIKLGTSILNIVIRNPIISARTLSSMDIISSGRLFAGVGPGSSKKDYDVCAISYEDRWKRFDEALQVLRLLWNSESSDKSGLANFDGRYYKMENISKEPKPVQKPHPPILVGSWGSEAGLKRAAKYGDGWMASAYNITPEKFKEKWKMVLSYRRSNGKDAESFQNSMMSMFGYIDNDKKKVQGMVKNILSPVLGRSPEDLERSLLFGSVDHCIKKINILYDAGVKSIHFWPTSDFNEQIEIFSKEIASNY